MVISDILNIRAALPVNSNGGSIQTKYKIAKFMKETDADVEFFKNAVTEIVNECAKKDADGMVIHNEDGSFPLNDDKRDTFIQKTNELNGTEVSVPNIRFSIEEFSDFEISANDLIALDAIIE